MSNASEVRAKAKLAHEQARLHEISAQLIRETPGATYLLDVEKVLGRPAADLIAEEAGIPVGDVMPIITGRRG